MKKFSKIVSVMLTVITLLTCMPTVSLAADGDLTLSTVIESEKTYYIRSADDLRILSILINQRGQSCKGATFELTNDIILNEGVFSLSADNEPLYNGVPIEEATDLILYPSIKTFNGRFNGNDYSISGFYSDGPGLFENLESAQINQLCIKNSLFDLRGTSVSYAGGLCGKAKYSYATSVVFNGIIINDNENSITGGVIGHSIYSFIRLCVNRGTVIGGDYCGGIIGTLGENGSQISNCTNYGNVISSGNFIGGIISIIPEDAHMYSCINAGKVESTGNFVGGIAGNIKLGIINLHNCSNTGSVKGNDYVGGLAGMIYTSGDNFESEWLELKSLEKEMDAYADTLKGDKTWADVWPPAWADEKYMEMYEQKTALEESLYEKMDTKKVSYCYGAGNVSSEGEYVGALFGSVEGCVWSYGALYVSRSFAADNIRSTGKNTLEETQARLCGSSMIGYKYEDEMKTENFAKVMSVGAATYVVDTGNKNNGFVLPYYIDHSTEPGYTEEDLPMEPEIKDVTYVQSEDTRKTFTVKADGRKQMIQFIEPDGGTRTYDRYNKNVSITSYNADGEVVNAMSRDLAYEVWEIYSNMSVGVEIQVRGKENGVWDSSKFSFTVEPYSPLISMGLAYEYGSKGPVQAIVNADSKTEMVMFKMPDGSTATYTPEATYADGGKFFIGNAWMNEDGYNLIKVYFRRNDVWVYVGKLEYWVV